MRAIVRSRWGEDAHRDRSDEWLAALDAVCAVEAPPVQVAMVSVLLERVIYAMIADGDSRETAEVLTEIADALAAQTRQVLLAVFQGVVSPSAYQTM